MVRNLRSTASDEIYNIIRKEILSLEFLPGQELKINTLCEQLQVSRSPVRDALMKLSTDGLVDIFPQRGTRVSLIDLQLVEEEKFLRSSLEEKALIQALSILNEKDIAKYKTAIINQENLKTNTELYDFFNSDVSFHKITFDIVNKKECWKLITQRCVNYDRVRFLSFKNNKDEKTIIKQHYDIIDALNTKNRDIVESVISTHLSKIDYELNSLFEKHPSFFKAPGKKLKLSLS